MVLIGVMACSQKSETTLSQGEPEVMTLEVWKSLPAQIKYDGATLEKLRQHDKKLRSNRAWQKYFRENVQPEMKKQVWSPHTK